MRTKAEDRIVPEIHMDYCFLGKVDEQTQPILVMKDRDSGMVCSFLVQRKGGADEYVVKRALAFLQELGYGSLKILIKSDQESSIQSVIQQLVKARTDQVTLTEHSPVRSSGSNGVVERAIKEVENQIRTMKSALDRHVGCDVRASSNILPWMVEYASVLINRYLVGQDGRTAHERSRGKSSKMLGFEFGEVVQFRRIPTAKRLGKLDSLWSQGVFVGYRSQSSEYMVVNADGAFKTRTIKRLPVEERWEKEPIDDMKWTPWKVKDKADDVKESSGPSAAHEPFIDIRVDKSIDLPLPPKIEEEPMPRRVYLTKGVLDKYGMTDGCLGCTMSSMGNAGVAHSEECRRRIDKAMRKDPEAARKLREVKEKQKQFIDRHAKMRTRI